MIRLTNLADYAIVLMVEMSRNSERINASDLATSTGIPLPTVSKILGSLGRNGLLQSHRGLRGGFSLSRPAEEISVAEIIEAVDGPIALVNCLDSNHSDCAIMGQCGMRTNWQYLNDAVRNTFQTVTLAKMANTSHPLDANVTLDGDVGVDVHDAAQ